MNIENEKLLELIGHLLEMDVAANRYQLIIVSLLSHFCCNIRRQSNMNSTINSKFQFQFVHCNNERLMNVEC